MADILDQIQKRRDAAQNQRLVQADANNTWAQGFNSIPAADKALAAQDLDSMIAKVAARKQAANEASDPKIALAHARTQEVLDRTKHANDMAPLAVQFKQAQFKALGEHERFVIEKDKQTMADTAGFFQDAAKIADKPGTPSYQTALNGLIQKYPRVIGTQVGSDALKRLHQEHQDVMALTPPAGMAVDRYETDDQGKTRAVFKPITAPAGFVGTPDEARAHYGPDATIHETAKGVWTSTIKSPDSGAISGLEKERAMHAKMLDRAKRIRSKATDTNVIADADADILESEKALADVESQIRSQRSGGVKTTAMPDITPEAHAALKSGEKFWWKGQQLTKQ